MMTANLDVLAVDHSAPLLHLAHFQESLSDVEGN